VLPNIQAVLLPKKTEKVWKKILSSMITCNNPSIVVQKALFRAPIFIQIRLVANVSRSLLLLMRWHLLFNESLVKLEMERLHNERVLT
jgi:hypothetical protein